MQGTLIMSMALMLMLGTPQDDAPKNDLQKQDLKGKVKIMVERTYDPSANKAKQNGVKRKELKLVFSEEGKLIEKSLTEYDSEGYLSSRNVIKFEGGINWVECQYDTDGSLQYKSAYKYYEDENKMEESRYDSDGSLEYKGVIKHDNNNQIEYCFYRSDESLSRKEIFETNHYIYDKNGSQIEWRGEKPSDSLSFLVSKNYVDGSLTELNGYKSDSSLYYKEIKKKYSYQYDEKGKQIEGGFPESNEESLYFVNKYDKYGNLIETGLYESNDSFSSKKTYKYDGNRNVIEERDFNPDGSLSSKLVYKYDENGKQTERTYYYPNGSIAFKEEFKFDENGNELGNIYYNPDGSIEYGYVFNYKYEYDKHKNWTSKICLSGKLSDVNLITERTFEYY